ncbi:MAG: EamA family transporter [Alphaproteobacteria bacterium]|nr:EamA family transporter [Alphaproteobacteria bacterium]
MTAIAPGRRQLQGILSLCVGVFVFSLQDIVIKRVSGDYPVHEVMVIRSLAAMPFLLAIVHFEVGLRALRTSKVGLILARGSILILSYTLYYLGFPALPLAAAVSLWFIAPLVIAGLAGLLLRERIGVRRWIAIMVGFSGVLVILRPGSGVLDPAAILPVVAAIAYAFGQILARRLGETQRASVLAFYQNVMFFSGAALMALVFRDSELAGIDHPTIGFLARPWAVPTMIDLVMLLACGPIAACGVYFLTNAYRMGEANVVAPFEYTGMIWAATWGFAFWGEVPSVHTAVGVAILLGAGLYVMHSGRKDA